MHGHFFAAVFLFGQAKQMRLRGHPYLATMDIDMSSALEHFSSEMSIFLLRQAISVLVESLHSYEPDDEV